MNERWRIYLYNYEWIIITSIVLVFLSSFSSSNNNSVWLIDIPNETASNKEGVSLWGVSLLLSSFFISLLLLVSTFGDDGIEWGRFSIESFDTGLSKGYFGSGSGSGSGSGFWTGTDSGS